MQYISTFITVAVISLAMFVFMLVDVKGVKDKIKYTGRVINMWEHNGWGDSMYFISFQGRRVTGHMWQKPRIGDELRSRMKSGKVARFLVVSVDNPGDPPDQFFCTVSDLDYLEGVAEKETQEKRMYL